MQSADPDYPAATCTGIINSKKNPFSTSSLEEHSTMMNTICTAAWNSNLSVLERLVEQEHHLIKNNQLNQIHNNNNMNCSSNASSTNLSSSTNTLTSSFSNLRLSSSPPPSSSIPSSSSIPPSSPSSLLVDNDLDSFTGFGPLHFSASLGNIQITNHLLDHHPLINKNSRDKLGNTPLIHSLLSPPSSFSPLSLPSLFIDHGVDVNSQNYNGETALFIAASLGLLPQVEFLLENGAKIQIPNLDGATALHAAAAGGWDEVVKVLGMYGAWVNVGDDEEDTAVHYAVREGECGVLRVLKELGADFDARNTDGETAMDLAKSLGSWEVVKILRELGAKENGGGGGGVRGMVEDEDEDEDCGMELDGGEELQFPIDGI
eukprot:TRINITY_DN1455_c0_g2_i1.p1 TRINITY_DN1455_c0_g2~~TRINITY_DN1455_c0_g2_i1.p1  ORF type:complete len:375 (-),score=168.13 TRINITY_DN1455_c0_g2_i1:79-1203(-)